MSRIIDGVAYSDDYEAITGQEITSSTTGKKEAKVITSGGTGKHKAETSDSAEVKAAGDGD